MSYLRNRITFEPVYDGITSNISYTIRIDIFLSVVLDPGIPAAYQKIPVKGVRLFTEFQIAKNAITYDALSTGTMNYYVQLGVRLN